MIRTASFSGDRRYRYRLGRRWGTGAELPWIMLNPSTADDSGDDPTIRRVISFSRSWGYGACSVVNLFAFRCTDPGDLRRVGEPVGRRNAAAVAAAIDDAAASGGDRIVLAWGADGARWLADPGGVGRHVRGLAVGAAVRWTAAALGPVTLGITSRGAPRHPLYVRAATPSYPLTAHPLTHAGLRAPR